MRALDWTLRARNEINALDHPVAIRIYKALKRYAATGAGDGKQLKAPILLYRLRVGDWRVIFTLEDKGTLRIARVAHRSDIYRQGSFAASTSIFSIFGASASRSGALAINAAATCPER